MRCAWWRRPANRSRRSPGSCVNEGTLGNWCAKARRDRRGGDDGLSESERAELDRLRRENIELRMQRDVLKRSVALWVDEAMGR